MATIAEQLSSTDEFVGAVSGALRGDTARARAIVERARQRVEDRARGQLQETLDAIGRPRAAGAPSTATGQALAPRPVPPLSPVVPVQIALANGRRLRVAQSPAPARRRDLAALGRVTAENDRMAFQALARQGRAMRKLARRQKKLEERVAELEEQSDVALLGIVDKLTGFERRFQTAAAETRTVTQTVSRQGATLRSQMATAQIQKVTAAVSSAQVAAYGEKGSVFALNNILLAGNQLLWSFADPLLRVYGLDGLGWLAPLGSLATGGLTAGRRTNIRFISGVTTLPAGRTEVRVSVLDQIATGQRAAFRKRTDVLVTAKAVDKSLDSDDSPPDTTLDFVPVEAQVSDGTLILTVEFTQDRAVRIAWVVDTGLTSA